MDRLGTLESRKIDIIGDKSASVLEMVSLVLLTHYDGLELLVVDGAGSVLVDLVNHLVNIGLRHRLVKGQRDLLQHWASMVPLPSLSRILKASLTSFSSSASLVFFVMRTKNSSKSTNPEPSPSTSSMHCWS